MYICISATGPVTRSQIESIRAKYWKACTFILTDQRQKRQEKHKTRQNNYGKAITILHFLALEQTISSRQTLLAWRLAKIGCQLDFRSGRLFSSYFLFLFIRALALSKWLVNGYSCECRCKFPWQHRF